jgi:hypothetical protein
MQTPSLYPLVLLCTISITEREQLIDMTINHDIKPSYASTVVQNATVVNYGDGDNSYDEHQQRVTLIPDSNVYFPIIQQQQQQSDVNPDAGISFLPNPDAGTSFPPHNCPDGGQWGTL